MKKHILVVMGIALVSLLLFWAPFVLKIGKFWGIEFGGQGMEVVVANFDGVNFLSIAKSWYDPVKLAQLSSGFDATQEPIYFSAHYPLTAGVVWIFDLFVTGPRAVMATIVLANLFLAYGLYAFFSEWVGKKQAWWLTAVALFLPARMLSVRGVLSSETLFIPLTLLSLVQAKRGKDWSAGGLGALAVLTRSPGIILFGGYLLAKWQRPRELLPYLLIPAALLGLWGVYGLTYGSFFAYFQSGDNLHLFWPPFRVFGTGESWVSGMWREEIIYIYLLLAAGVAGWWGKARGVARYYPALFLLVIIFVVHRDIARYSLPLSPFVLAGLAKYLSSKRIRVIVALLVVPVYLYAWQFVLSNVQPVADWTGLI